MPDRIPGPGIPQWVKTFGIVVIVAVLLLIILLLAGGHGPGRHTSDGDMASMRGQITIT